MLRGGLADHVWHMGRGGSQEPGNGPQSRTEALYYPWSSSFSPFGGFWLPRFRLPLTFLHRGSLAGQSLAGGCPSSSEPWAGGNAEQDPEAQQGECPKSQDGAESELLMSDNHSETMSTADPYGALAESRPSFASRRWHSQESSRRCGLGMSTPLLQEEN